MNNKLLLPLALSVLAGCVTNKPVTVPVTGTGGGSAGLQQGSNNDKTVSPPLNTSANTVGTATGNAKLATPSISTTANASTSSTLIDKTAYSSSNSSSGSITALQQPAIETKKPLSDLVSTSQSKPGLIIKPKNEPTVTATENSPKIVASYESGNNIALPKLPVYSNTSSESKSKKADAEKVGKSAESETTETPAAETLTKISKRYSNNSNKAVPSSHPTSAGNPSSYIISGENYKVLPFSNGFVEKGIASWYGPDFHGEKTSNGETYDMYGMTAAHKRLPIPSYVKVTNLKNKRSITLRINDRGPFYADRVIDLSYAAAQKLDIHQPGTEMVQIEAVNTPTKESVYLQLGVFANPANAQLLQKKVVENKMPEPVVKEIVVAGKVAYRVQLGPLFSMDKVNEFNTKLAKMGISETWYVTDNKI